MAVLAVAVVRLHHIQQLADQQHKLRQAAQGTATQVAVIMATKVLLILLAVAVVQVLQVAMLLQIALQVQAEQD